MTKRKSLELLPVIFRTESNNKFLSSTIDQFIQQPEFKKIDGFIGSKIVKNNDPSVDSYVNSEKRKSLRSDYELEPGITLKNSVDDTVQYAKTYEDILNALKFYGSDIADQNRLFRQTSYAWNPHIDLDKFVNYRNYIWMPNGPDTITVLGKEKDITSVISVTSEENFWKFSTDDVAVNPTLTLYRGQTYIFNINADGKRFFIKSRRTSGDLDLIENVLNNGASSGQVIFEVKENTPSTIYYVDGDDVSVFGKILVRNLADNFELDVEREIVGKIEYEIKKGQKLSNGMKIRFSDNVVPEKYKDKTFLVEGVGSGIKLIDFDNLVTIESYASFIETSFDSDGFDELPFDQVSDFPLDPDYIVINRASKDLNPWSRYNRWFHIDVIISSSVINDVDPEFLEKNRAKRPIIEFYPDIQLFNFASNKKKYVTILDSSVTDAFSQVEGSIGFYCDDYKLENNNRIIFTNDTDERVRNKIYQVQFLDIEGVKRIHLEPTNDSVSDEGDGLLVLFGKTNGRSTWVFKNNQWSKAQTKNSLNQPPIFDLYDEDGNSFSSYKESNFLGNKLFGYQIGSGPNDTILGFPIKFSNVANVGGYLFQNYIFTESFSFLNEDNEAVSATLKNGYLRINTNNSARFENFWVRANKQSIQEIYDYKVVDDEIDILSFNSIDKRTLKNQIRVFKNGAQLNLNQFDKDDNFENFTIVFSENLKKYDLIVVKAEPAYKKLDEGFYETPINLVNNPLNQCPNFFTYAEINDHLNSILLNANKDSNNYIDSNNLRDNLNLEKYGRRFVQHDGLVSLAGAMVVDKDINFIKSLRWAGLEYQKYKTKILQKFSELESYSSVSEALDEIILSLSKENSINSPFYYSDMLPYGFNKRDFSYVIKDSEIKSYAYGTDIFDKNVEFDKAILVYLNGQLLLKNRDYQFNKENPLIDLLIDINVGDQLLIKFYNSVYGSCMPFSPSKLGIYPTFEPKKYFDDTYIDTVEVIQGHDGSITVCYNDDRDLLLLELESRIYNNLESTYNPSIFDINDVLPGFFRNTPEELAVFNNSIEEEFLRWSGIYNIEFRTNEGELYQSNFSYNYVNSKNILNSNVSLTGSWRKLYKFHFDTDRPHTHPWEMLGFYNMPDWWEDEYGPAPYTSGNEILWEDLEKGYIRSGERQGIDEKYKRPGLSKIIPVNTYGELKDPIDVNLAKTFDFTQRYKDWSFGEIGPTENAWRRSSFYPFALQIAFFLNQPAKYGTLCFDTFRNYINITGQVVYKENKERFNPRFLKIYGKNTNEFVYATGYSPYIVENLRLRHTDPTTKLKDFVNKINCNLIYKVGGFTSKQNFRVALESVSSYKTVDKVFIPEENYQIILSESTPVKTLSMSAVIVQKIESGFVVRGYDTINPYFKIVKPIGSPSDPVLTVGGVSESFVYWAPNSTITSGTIVANGPKYYRAISDHLTKNTFDLTLYYPLPFLPLIGGVEVRTPQKFEEDEFIVSYGTEFKTVQEVYNFILGYGKWLENQGFVFDNFVQELESLANWNLSGKEFLFWSLQNWAKDSVICLSPFAGKTVFKSEDTVVGDVYDPFYDYTVLKSDGTNIDRNRTSILREDNSFIIDTSEIPNDGLYFVKINLVQKEHLVIFDNFTIFNDLIYQPYSGYRQLRFRINGFVTDNWTGDFYTPGFIYDSARIDDWQPNVDYSIGDVVKYQSNYYQAKKILLPKEVFSYEDWELLGEKPVAQLLPNFEYKISQFEDFYSVETENFDAVQQSLAQKLIGYIPRKYLNSLILDKVSQYKFYQGFIKEKGTVQPLEKFSVAHNQSLGTHIDLDEEWAVRLGVFGGDSSYKEIEFTLDQNKFSQDPQLFEFSFGQVTPSSSKSYVINQSDLLIKPDDFDGTPWPIFNIDKNIGQGYTELQKFPTAGYVRIDDVTFTALYENNLKTISSGVTLQEGDTVWVAMDGKGDWSVKRYSISRAKIVNYIVDNANNLIQFITDINHNLKLREFVSVTKLNEPLNGLYEVIGITDPNSFVVRTEFNDIEDPTEILNGFLYVFSNSRFKIFDDIANIAGLDRWADCEFVWVDDDGSGNWAVLEKGISTKSLPLRPYVEESNQHFGNTVKIAPYSNNIVVSATNLERGRVYIYKREVVGIEDIELEQSFLMEENFSDILTVQTLRNGTPIPEHPRNHGKSLSIWENESLTERYIVAGAPNSSNCKWLAPGTTLSNAPLKKSLVFTYQPSGIFDEGAISISKYDTVQRSYVKEVVLASPNPQESANFGHDLLLVGTQSPFLIVSSPNQDNVGSVFMYYLDNNKVWQVYQQNDDAYDIRSEVGSLSSKSEFGWSIASSRDGSLLAISAPGNLKDRQQAHSGSVFILQKDNVTNKYSLKQTIYADDNLSPNDLLLKGVTKTYSTTDFILRFDTLDNSLTRNRGNFIQDGFRIGQTIAITGSQQNNFEFIISDLTTNKIIFKDITPIIDEVVSTTITLTGLGSFRNDRFGDKILFDELGKTLIISSDHASQDKLDAGLVYVFELSNDGQFVLSQKVSSPAVIPGEMFGSNMALSPDSSTLLISAAGGSQSTLMNFDTYSRRFENSAEIYGSEYVLDPKSALRPNRTTFDDGSTSFVDRAKNSGSVYLFQRLGKKYVFGESLISGDAAENDKYGEGLDTDGRFILVGAPKYDLKIDSENANNQVSVLSDSGTVIFFDKKELCGCGSSWSWTKVRSQELGQVNSDKIKRVISYNSSSLKILEEYEIYDPVKGKLPSKILQEIKYITPFDPAVYTVAVENNSKVRVDNKTTWSEDHVGELWLDLSTLRYVWYEQGSEDYRFNNWGKLFPGSTVDVYEWVKSDYRPSEWSQLADTEEGLALGISGQPKHPDNSVVSINQYFDPVINDFINVYYFWVRNKITLPDLSFRSISSFECARIIEDPKTQGIKYASFLSPKSMSLTNTRRDLDASKINVNVYFTDNDELVNRHSHWQLISEKATYLSIDSSIEIKLIDSLVGQDRSGNEVPDPELSPKLKYGTAFRPRQSWFKNRNQAVKTLIDFVNTSLKQYDVVGKIQLDSIDVFDPIPTEKSGLYDEIIETSEDLDSVSSVFKVTAVLEPEILNGRIVNVNIINSGFGYKIAPKVEILGNGIGGSIQTIIDISGKIIGVQILSQGEGYDASTRMIVRPYAVLSLFDVNTQRWSIFHLIDRKYERKISQTYDVRKYWDYVDWVARDYSAVLPPKYVVDFISDIDSLNYDLNDTVEIRNTGDGRKIVLRKTQNSVGNYLPDFDIVYREKGTIQFSSKLYDKTLSGLGYDTFIGFDQSGYDETNYLELRIILESIKKNIFVGELAHYWRKFVFVAMRYVLSEQLFVDWLYKTSFINPIVDAGPLDQKEIYRFNDFSYVEEFIKEIKPYKSKFRQFTVKNNINETLGVSVSDFDLPYESINVDDDTFYKIWNKHKGFGISEINVANKGNNYRLPPQVVIVPAVGDTGFGTEAFARISDGKVSEIVVTNPGTGYLKTPTVLLVGGGNYDENFVEAKASAVLSNDKVRTNLLGIKFDRTSKKGLLTGEIYNRNFVTDGQRISYVLTYPVNDLDDNFPALQDENLIKVFLNTAEIPKENYRITFRADLSTVITFNVALPANQNLRIQYIKNSLYTKDIFQQTDNNFRNIFQLTFPPELDTNKFIVTVKNNSNNLGSEVISSDYKIELKQINDGFIKYVGFIRLKNTPPKDHTIIVQYAKNINIQNAVDRIVTSYFPKEGMPGKDIDQLIKGINFGGVEIEGLNFTVSSGWDGLPWFSQGWDTFLNEYRDLLVISDGTTDRYNLGYTPLDGTQINVYFDNVRVDDENFGTNLQKNSNALFKTIILNSQDFIVLPVVPAAGTKIEIRQSLSDGVTLPTDEIVLDTNLSGGNFNTINDAGEIKLVTATGLRADDITVDGGEFISVEHSNGPEELVSGEISDTLSVTVFNSPSKGSSFVDTYQFQYDGTTNIFEIDGTVDSLDSVDVYVGNFVANRNDDFTVTTTPDNKTRIELTSNNFGLSSADSNNRIIITIQKLSIGGDKILDRLNYFVTQQDENANSFEIPLAVNYNDIGSYYISVSNFNSLSKLSGRSKRSKIVVSNASPKLTEGKLITVLLFGTETTTYSEVFKQEIEIDSRNTYELSRPPGNIEPLHTMVVVTRTTPATASWKGQWKEGVVYAQDDSVVFKNVSYACIKPHLSSKFLSDLTHDTWVSNTQYNVFDTVLYQGIIYVCILDHISVSPGIMPINTLYWEIYSANSPEDDVQSVYWEAIPKQRMLPPETEYYEVTEDAQIFSIGNNIPYLPRSLSVFDIEVYRNGKKMTSITEYEFDNRNNDIKMRSGVTNIGDVIAISVLKNADYLIRANNIIFTRNANLLPQQKIVVTTYTNHDENLMRREVFKGYRYRNEYKLSRPVNKIDNVWVELNGASLTPNVDFRIYGLIYIQISEKYRITDTDRIVVTSISDQNTQDTTAYRIFKDMSNSYQFKRISKDFSTKLTKQLSVLDREVEVEDSSIFKTTLVNASKPGVIFIAGERIEFRSVKDNKLGNLTRGTYGTGVGDSYPTGTKVFSFAQSETIPYKEGNIISSFEIPENYRFNEELDIFEKFNSLVWQEDDNLGKYELKNFMFNDQLSYEDQVVVTLGGRTLLKPTKPNNPLIKHNFSLTLYSDEVNSIGESGDEIIDSDFTIEKIGDQYFININKNIIPRDENDLVISDLRIRVLQKIGKIWYTLNSDSSIQNETTIQARFLQETSAELPDNYYYGKENVTDSEILIESINLKDEDGNSLTDEDGNPLEIE